MLKTLNIEKILVHKILEHWFIKHVTNFLPILIYSSVNPVVRQVKVSQHLPATFKPQIEATWNPFNPRSKGLAESKEESKRPRRVHHNDALFQAR